MKRLIQQARLQYLIRNRNGFLMLASGSLMLNFLFIITLILSIGHEKIILVPPEINQSFWVGSHTVSPEYLSEMALFFTNLRFNVTSHNVDLQRGILLRYVHPKEYAEIKTALLLEADHINKEHISMAFYPTNVEVDTQKWLVRITGDLLATLGNTSLPTQRVTYLITFTYNSGRLLVTSFQEEKSHGSN